LNNVLATRRRCIFRSRGFLFWMGEKIATNLNFSSLNHGILYKSPMTIYIQREAKITYLGAKSYRPVVATIKELVIRATTTAEGLRQ
jgi:hypothetical protein